MPAPTLFDRAIDNRSLFSDHYLETRLPERDAWQEDVAAVFEEVKALHEEERAGLETANEAQTEEDFIKPLLRLLGWTYDVQVEAKKQGRRNVPDYALFTSKEDVDEAKPLRKTKPDAYFARTAAVADAKYWGRPLDATGNAAREPHSNKNPSFQIVGYMTAMHLSWGLLTNGARWRLYYAGARSRIDTFYEANLEHILREGDEDDFRRFFLFFRAAAFRPDAVSGRTFLESVYDGSVRYGKALEDRLKGLVFDDIFLHLAEGFVEASEKEKPVQDDLDEVYHSTLRLLYRLLFLLYAEARALLPVADRQGYYHYSLTRIKRDVAKAVRQGRTLSGVSTDQWNDLEGLFRIIDEGDADLNVPHYNGGLFDADNPANAFLNEHAVADKHLVPAIDKLARDADGDFVDYKALGVEQLGSIYEGLLEFRLRWSAADGLVLENDKGERKATGSYYTPHYIVAYITEHTLGPVLEARAAAFRRLMDEQIIPKYEKQTTLDAGGPSAKGLQKQLAPLEDRAVETLLSIKVCDPAMGSGHFLTHAVRWLTDRLVHILSAYPENPVQHRLDAIRTRILGELKAQGIAVDAEQLTPMNLLKRMVMKRCIYGVDLNPMAVELARLSLWLDSFTVGAPLSFLNHHLKVGNALIGERVRRVEGQLQTDLFGSAFAGMLQATELMQDIALSTDATFAEVAESAQKYASYEAGMTPYKRMLSLWTSRHFGNAPGATLLRDYGGQVRDALKGNDALNEKQQATLDAADAVAGEKRFFHWELEFPEVFFDLRRSTWKENPGFDAVIGNPPYVRIQHLNDTVPAEVDYYYDAFECSTGSYDLYLLFVERGYGMLAGHGQFGYILPNKFFKLEFGKGARQMLRREKALRSVVDLNGNQIFGEQTTYTCLLFLSGTENGRFRYVRFPRSDDPEEDVANWLTNGAPLSPARFNVSDFSDEPWTLVAGEEKALLDKLEKQSDSLDEVTQGIIVGLQTSADYVYVVRDVRRDGDDQIVYSEASEEEVPLEPDLLKPLVSGRHTERHTTPDTEELLIFPYELTDDSAALIPSERFAEQYPKTWNYLRAHETALRGRESGKMDHDGWYAFGRTQNLDKHEYPKLGTARLVNRLSFFGDFEGRFYLDNVDVNGVLLQGGMSPGYLLSVLNSTLLDWRFKQSSVPFRGDYFSANKQFIAGLPIRRITFETPPEERTRRAEEAIAAYEEAVAGDLPGFQNLEGLVEGHLAAAPERADVVHDLLAHLAERMTALHRSHRAKRRAPRPRRPASYAERRPVDAGGPAQKARPRQRLERLAERRP